MSVLETILSAILSGLVNGTSNMVSLITQGVLTSVNLLMAGLNNLIGIPLGYWETNGVSSSGITTPVVFTVILGISGIIALAFIDIKGIEDDVQSGLTGLEEML